MGCQSIAGLHLRPPPHSIKFAGTHLHTRVERGTECSGNSGTEIPGQKLRKLAGFTSRGDRRFPEDSGRFWTMPFNSPLAISGIPEFFSNEESPKTKTKADYTLLFASSGVRRYTFDNLPLGVTGNPSL